MSVVTLIVAPLPGVGVAVTTELGVPSPFAFTAVTMNAYCVPFTTAAPLIVAGEVTLGIFVPVEVVTVEPGAT